MSNLKSLIKDMALGNVSFGRACFAGLALTTGIFAYMLADGLLAPFVTSPGLRMYPAVGFALLLAWMVDAKLYEGVTSAVGAVTCEEFGQSERTVKIAVWLYLVMYVGRMFLSIVFTLLTATFSGDLSDAAKDAGTNAPPGNAQADVVGKMTAEANQAHAAALKSADAWMAAERERAAAVLESALVAFPADQRRAYADGKWVSADLRRAVRNAQTKAEEIETAAAKGYAARTKAADQAHAAALAMASAAGESVGAGTSRLTKRADRLSWFTAASMWGVDLILIVFGSINCWLLGVTHGTDVRKLFPAQPGITDVIKVALMALYNILVGSLSWGFSYAQLGGATLMDAASTRVAEANRLSLEAGENLAAAQQGRGGGTGANSSGGRANSGGKGANSSGGGANSSGKGTNRDTNSNPDHTPTPPGSREENKRPDPGTESREASSGAGRGPGDGQADPRERPRVPSPTLPDGDGETHANRGANSANSTGGANSANSSEKGANSANSSEKGANSANSRREGANRYANEYDRAGLEEKKAALFEKRKERKNAGAQMSQYAKRALEYDAAGKVELAENAQATAEQWSVKYEQLRKECEALWAEMAQHK